MMLQPIIHLAVQAAVHQQQLGPWYDLLFNPELCEKRYLPSMPEDELQAILAAMKENVGVYECPNGHRYTVGNCTMTNASSKCPDCGAVIGNNPNAGAHTMAGGNKLIGVSKNDPWARGAKNLVDGDSSPPGYVVNGPQEEADLNKQSRAMRPITFRILRYLVNGILGLSCAMGKEGGVKKLKNTVSLAWFVTHIQQDFNLISQLANISPEETWMQLHFLVSRLPQKTFDFEKPGERNEYEVFFQEKAMAPVFDNAKVIRQEVARAKEASEGGGAQVAIGNELSETTPKPSPDVYPHLLRFREPLTLPTFLFSMNSSMDIQELFPVLYKYVTSVVKLDVSSALADLLQFQKLVFARYARKLSRVDADNKTIMQAIEEYPAEREQWWNSFQLYRKAWNKVAPHCTQFECNQNFVMPLFPDDDTEAANKASIKWGLTDINTTDPTSCYAKLHLDLCLEAHNEFVQLATQHLARGGNPGQADEAIEPEALHLCGQGDMLTADPSALEDATRAHASQSLQYSEGHEVTYDHAALEKWVIEVVIHDAPEFQTIIPLFHFAGEKLPDTGPLGGVEQIDLPSEVTGLLEKELTSLEACARCHERLVECMDFLNILTGDGEMSLGDFGTTQMKLPEREIADLGGPASTVRNMVKLKHLRSLSAVLKDRTVDPLANVHPKYTDPLTEEMLEECEAAGPLMDLNVLCGAMKKNLSEYFQGFLEPVGAESMLGGDWSGWLDAVEVEWEGNPGTSLVEIEWFDDQAGGGFPRSLMVANYKEAYLLFCKMRDEGAGHFG